MRSLIALLLLCPAARAAEAWPPVMRMQEAAPAVPGAPAPDPALERLLAKLPFEGTPEEKAFFLRIAARMMESPSARGLAEAFVRAGAAVPVRFEEFPGTKTYERAEGRLAFDAAEAAHSMYGGGQGASIALNRACLRIDPEYAAIDCTRHLAHEAFGHILGWLEAPSELRLAYENFDSEYFARLVDWTVILELQGSLRDPEPYCAASEPEAYARGLKRRYPYSAWSLALDELRDPDAALRGRLAEVNARLAAPDPMDKTALEKMRGLITDETARLDYYRTQPGGLSAFPVAAATPFFRAFIARSERFRTALLSRSDDLIRWTCDPYR